MEPTTIIAGDTAEWTAAHPLYRPEDGWTLTYTAYNKDGRLQFAATDNGDSSFAVSLPPTTTGSFAPGDYQLVGQVAKGSDRHTISITVLTIRPNYADQDGGLDDRTVAQRHLDSLHAARAKLVGGAYRASVSSESMPGVSRTFRTLDEIDAAIRRAQRDVNREIQRARAAEGKGHHGRVKVQFSG